MMIIPPLQAIGQPQADIETARRGATVGLPLLLALFTFAFILVFAAYATAQLLVFALVALLLLGAAVPGTIDRKMGSLVGLVVSFCGAALPWVCVWQLLQEPHRPRAIVLLLTLVWLADAAAYFGGKYFGKRPLAKVISPSKTMEGMFQQSVDWRNYRLWLRTFSRLAGELLRLSSRRHRRCAVGNGRRSARIGM